MDNYYYFKHDDDDEVRTGTNAPDEVEAAAASDPHITYSEEEEKKKASSDKKADRKAAKKKKSGLSFGQKIGVTLAGCAAAGLVVGGGVAAYNVVTNLNRPTQEAAASGQSQSESPLPSIGSGNETVTEGNTGTQQSGSSASTGSSSALIQTNDDDDSNDMTVEELAEATLPGMVAITNVSVQEVQNYFGGYGDYFNQFFGNGSGSYGYGDNSGSGNTQTQTSAGSGVIIYKDDSYIYMLTNQHVVEDATELSVAFCDEAVASAQVVGEDADNDLAVIKVALSDVSEETQNAIAYIPLGSSSDLKIGQSVVAIGNALGYGQSVSSGIVSALDRSMDGGTGIYADGLIQTDAAINPGNSGGALLDMDGNLVGINSAKYSSTSVEGMGYAIPIDSAYPVLEAMIEGTYGTGDTSADTQTEDQTTVEATSDAYLGISCATITEEYAEYYGMPQGVYVDSPDEGGAAANAGIVSGDIITEADGKTITSINDLTEVLNAHNPGDQIQLRIYRNGNTGTATVTLGSRTEAQASSASESSEEVPANGTQG